MKQDGKVQLPWAEIDTLLLDMDGTLLDLAFDNFFWLELVPEEFARARGIAPDEARHQIEAQYAAVVGTLPWYCIDHWNRELGLDLQQLKQRHRHRIRYLPGATDFLALARRRGKRLILVTNAHRITLSIKCEQTGVDGFMDAVVSSHDYGVEKEQPAFWQRLADEHRVDPERAVLLEDSLAVLGTARAFGLTRTIAIARPDSGRAARRIDEFPAIDGVAQLID